MTTTITAGQYRLTLFVPGQPFPQGSKGFKGLVNGHAVMVESAKQLGPWRERIALAAHNFTLGTTVPLPFTGQPLELILKFVMPRPKSAPKSYTPPAIQRPDIDKLARAVCDALTGIIFSDDAAIIHLDVYKRRAEINESPGVHISVTSLP